MVTGGGWPFKGGANRCQAKQCQTNWEKPAGAGTIPMPTGGMIGLARLRLLYPRACCTTIARLGGCIGAGNRTRNEFRTMTAGPAGRGVDGKHRRPIVRGRR